MASNLKAGYASLRKRTRRAQTDAGTTELDAHRRTQGAAELDAAELDAAELDAAELDGPNMSAAELDAAHAAFARGDHASALAAWSSALQALEPPAENVADGPSAGAAAVRAALLTNIGAAHERMGRAREAVAAYDAALAAAPLHVDALHNRGVALKALGRLEEALASFDAALACAPDFVPSLRGRGDLLTHLGRYGDAVECASRAVALQPAAPGPLCDRAFALLKARRLQEALGDYRRLIRELHDDSPETAHLYAVALSHRAVELDRAAGGGGGGCGGGGVGGGDGGSGGDGGAAAATAEQQQLLLLLEEAGRLYDEAIAIEPTDSRLFNRALLRMRQHRRPEAIAGFREVLARTPANAAALGALGTLLLEAGAHEAEAAPLLARAHALRPGDAAVAFNLGYALLKVRSFDGAVRAFAAAHALDPCLASAAQALATAQAAAAAATAAAAAAVDGGGDGGSGPLPLDREAGGVGAPPPLSPTTAGAPPPPPPPQPPPRKGSVSERFRADVRAPPTELVPGEGAPATRSRALSLVAPGGAPSPPLPPAPLAAAASRTAAAAPPPPPSSAAGGAASMPPPARWAAQDGTTTTMAVAVEPSAQDGTGASASASGGSGPAPPSPSRHFLALAPGQSTGGYQGLVLSHAQLTSSPGSPPLPPIDVAHREAYLDAREFEALFGVDKVTFYKLPKWRRQQRKKDLSLF